LNSALRGGLLAVPEALSTIGRLAAALLAGAALVPAITLPIAAHDKSDYDSAAAATSKYLGFIAKAVGIAVSGAASVYFGLSRNINPFVAALAGFVLESCFLWAYFMLIRAMKSRDAFDIWLWRVAVILFGLFLAVVSVETISTLANIDVPIVKVLGEIGATLYVSAVGLSLILTILAHVATSMIDMPMQPASAQTIDGNQPTTVVKPAPAPLSRRIAGGIRGARAGIDEIRAAWTDTQPQPAQLNRAAPSLTTQTSENTSISVNSTIEAGEEVPARPSKR
jgi:hypothetical protein